METCFDDPEIVHDSKSQPVNSEYNLTKGEEKFLPNINLSSSTDKQSQNESKDKSVAKKDMNELEKEKMIIELELEEISSGESDTSNEDHDDSDLKIVLDSKSQPVNSDFNLTKSVKKMISNKTLSSTSYGSNNNEDKSKAKHIAEKNMDELEKEKMMIELELEEINSKHKSQLRNVEMQKTAESSRDNSTENLSHKCALCHKNFLLLTNLYKHMENCVKYYPQ